MDIVLALVMKGEKSGKPRQKQKTGRDQPMEGFMHIVPMSLADRGQQVSPEQMSLDHKKKYQKPEKIDSFDPLNKADGFTFPVAPVHDYFPQNHIAKNN